MKLIDIAVLSKTSGVSTSTLRYYEEIGLIQSPARNGLRRQYSEDTLVQLAVISLGKAAGFSLEEIGRIFNKDTPSDLPRPTLQQRADEIDRQVRRMKTLSHMLRHVAQCQAPSHMECERFRKLLRVACPAIPATPNAAPDAE
ncbi:MerR family transcriptional regulator [Alcaligenes pakistanensis]|uniref:MerR family transcriptional regulator n=1 Tax=Alcaligenes pakistanensis TaxID=1482717 RepID=A0A8H9M6T1_9BURK|nr:helix-turn-helix domain-containing protein [Alcaligenes pakistanensis]GHC40531.1 MerR family transcriptional regulator [Alcaligenes pakistanensis]HCA15623.1 MerR family transcriptional regulator [Alcaligenes faecalis]